MFCAFLMILCENLSAQNLTAKNISANANSTADLEIDLNVTTIPSTVAFTIDGLPEGISVASDEDGIIYTAGSLMRRSNSVSKAEGRNTYVVAGTVAMKGAKGSLITLELTIGDVKTGVYTCTLTKVSAATPDGLELPESVKHYLTGSSFTISVTNPTAIKNVTVDKSAKKAGIYTIAGQKLNKITESGVYIVDGKKVAVKK